MKWSAPLSSGSIGIRVGADQLTPSADLLRTRSFAGHDRRFESWSYETDRPLSVEALRKAAGSLPADVYRAKGVIAAAEAPESRGVLQVVGKRVDVTFDGEWGQQPPRTRIVAIGAAGTIGPGDLEKHFAACLVEGDSAADPSLHASSRQRGSRRSRQGARAVRPRDANAPSR